MSLPAMTDPRAVTVPKPSVPARAVGVARRWAYRLLVLPLTTVYMAVMAAGLLALGYSALRALLSACGAITGGAFDWLPE